MRDLAKADKGAHDVERAAEAKRWIISGAFQCAQGMRARELNCDELQSYADFQPQPLTGPNKVRAAPQWKARATWPAVPVPKD